MYRFRQTAQEPNETLDQFHTRLRTLSETCEFADLEFEIEQQIIVGGTSTKIRKRALRDPTFDLKCMLIEGRRDEQSTYQAKQIESKEPSDGETKKLEQQSRASSGVTCKRHSTKHGLDWTGLLDWTIGLDSWTGQLDWTVGLDY